ncbi:MAG: hypothetical protein GX610_00735 [Rhodococcus sp.]|nr:hypothetical protein [Rhodococcus sp. (in: high G+C Gram-positive bacteria)]
MTYEWPIPTDLSKEGKEAAELLKQFFTEKGITDHGGGGRFYSPSEWKDRGEQWGTESLLIITHDGGDHASAFAYDYGNYSLIDELQTRLGHINVFAEQCTSWYTALYRH